MKRIITIAIAFVFSMAVAGSVSASTLPKAVWQEYKDGVLYVWTGATKASPFYKSFSNPSDYKGEMTAQYVVPFIPGISILVGTSTATTTPAI